MGTDPRQFEFESLRLTRFEPATITQIQEDGTINTTTADRLYDRSNVGKASPQTYNSGARLILLDGSAQPLVIPGTNPWITE